MNMNPYEYLHPVIGASFVGRYGIINEICLELSLPEGESYAIVGGRRFGKTSLLLSIRDKVEETRELANILCVFIDLNQRFSSPEDFFGHTIQELYNIAFTRLQNANHIRQLVGNFNESASYSEFVYSIQCVLEKMPSNTKICFLLDEVDAVLKNEWHEILFDQLRTLANSSPVRNSVNLILAGTYYYYETKKRGSPLMNILRPVHLECMQESAIHDLARLGGEVQDEIRTAVWNYSGGHPHLAQYMFHNFWKSFPNFIGATESIVSRIVKQYYKEYNRNLKNWAFSIGQDARIIYDFLSQKDNWVDEEVIARNVKLSMSRTNQALVNLCFHGVVYANPETDSEYRAQGEVFRSWFKQNREDILGENEFTTTHSELQQNPVYHIKHLEIVQNKVEAENINGNVSQKRGITVDEIRKLFGVIHEQINSRPETSYDEKKVLSATVNEIEHELAKKSPEPTFLQKRFENLQKMAPDIFEVVVATVTNPISGFALLAKKIAEKTKKKAEGNI